MIDVIMARGPGEAARPAPPGRGLAQAHEAPAGRGFSALVDGPEQAAPEPVAKDAGAPLPEPLDEPRAEAGTSPSQADATALPRPDLQGDQPLPEGTGHDISGTPHVAPDELTGGTGDEDREAALDGLADLGPLGLSGTALSAFPTLQEPERPEGAGAGAGAAHSEAANRAPGPAGPSRAESVLAALVAAQAGGNGRAGEVGGPDAERPSGQDEVTAAPVPGRSAEAPPAPPSGTVAPAGHAAEGVRRALDQTPGPDRFPIAPGGDDRDGPSRREDLAVALPPVGEEPPAHGPARDAKDTAAHPGRDPARRPAGVPFVASHPAAGTAVAHRAGVARPAFAFGLPPSDREGGSALQDQSWSADRAPFALPGLTEAGAVSHAPDRAPAARHIARQIADHPVLRTGGAAEMSLAPEELGHLRLTVEGSEGALRVVIEAARPETADLLRRHVETLRQELRQEGLGSVGVSIGGGEARQGGGTGPRGGWASAERPVPAEATPSAPPAPAAVRGRTAAGQLDLRF